MPGMRWRFSPAVLAILIGQPLAPADAQKPEPSKAVVGPGKVKPTLAVGVKVKGMMPLKPGPHGGPPGPDPPSICGADAANLVKNCGFETGSFTNWTIQDWDVTTADDPVFANSGSDFAETGCVGAGCITPDPSAGGAWVYQNLATVPGQRYNLTFYYNPGGPGPAELQVLWGPSATPLVASPGGTCNATTNCIYDNTAGTLGWIQVKINGLVATSNSTRLEFLGRQDPSFNGIDDVMVDVASSAGATAGAPTLGAWGLAAMALLLLAGGVASLRTRTT